MGLKCIINIERDFLKSFRSFYAFKKGKELKFTILHVNCELVQTEKDEGPKF